jgi:hypothetical protein
VERIFSIRPIFRVPTFEVGASGNFGFEGHWYVKMLQILAKMNHSEQHNVIEVK